MDYVRKQFYRSKREPGGDNDYYDDHDQVEERAIVIHPGQVEEATHIISFPGRISLEELRFWAYVPNLHENTFEPTGYTNNNIKLADGPSSLQNTQAKTEQKQKERRRQTNNSYVDIAVIEIPLECRSGQQPPCDLTSKGIGKIEHRDDTSFLSLCDETTGRLLIDHEVFRGYHTVLHIPPTGMMMKDRIIDPKAKSIPSFPSQDSKYDVLIANCDQQAYGTGRNIGLSGQIIFESDPLLEKVICGDENKNSEQGTRFWSTTPDSSRAEHYYNHVGTKHQQEEYGGVPLDSVSQMRLLAMGLSICFIFSLLSLRIHNGTRADYFTARLNRRNRILENLSGSDDEDTDDDGNGERSSSNYRDNVNIPLV
ncbi:unnamed protein product [Pseudo-nitzschia multistriata]|uniref:Uncharacterized protein n=1 Tax=Pseudo-nitzschia multistriata TaxID=183589 RepID=A0A448YZS1_9STRA|nr:unnamed protein product [Pseudo-nitzschia multistriata]